MSQRKQGESESELLAALNEAFLPIADPEEIMSLAVRMLGEHLGVDRCGYAEVDVDGDHFVVMGEYIRGSAPKIVGRYRMSSFGDHEQKILLENRPYVVNDIEVEAAPGAELDLYRRAGIRALVCVPLTKAGHHMARMAVHQSTARRWSQSEIDLITAVAHRCWESVGRARALRGLKESDERYRAFIANSTEAIWRLELEQPISISLSEDEQIDLLYRYAYLAECNDVMARMYGYERADQIIGARIGDLLPRSDPHNIAFLRSLARSGYRLTDVQTCEVDKNGNLKYFSNSLVGIQQDGAIVRAWGTQRDIGERKRSEEQLRESEERFAKAFRASPNALVISRLSDGRILEVNDSFVSLSGFDRDELIGKTAVDLGLYVDPASRQRALAILKEQNRVREFEFTMKRRSGEERLISMSAEPLSLRGERCWLTIGYDITERRQAEKDREQLLRQEKAARAEAEATNRLKDEFLATISHELRTPLTSILGWSSMLIDGSLPESETRRALRVIQQNARAQARLVDDILDTSRIITGRLKLDAQPVDIESVFHAAIDVIRPSAEAKRITVRTVVEHHRVIVFGDANRLQQIIWNILSNAVKFTNSNGVIEARLKSVDGLVEISVKDTGIGIEPQFQPYIFDRFRQFDSTSTRRYSGLGLGLAIVRYLTEMHGGSISVSSAGASQGSTFTLRFPVASLALMSRPRNAQAEAQFDPSSEPASRQPHPLDGVRVLVVEDDPDTLDMLKVILDNSGAEAFTAGSTNEALQVLERAHPDALISDLAMPDRDGYDLINEVRSRGPQRGGNIPAVALSAYTRAEDRTRAIAAGFQMHVPKPVDPDRLISVLVTLTR